MAKNIIIQPIISEKSELLTEKLNKYSFEVERTANKIEIKKAIEEKYSVNVASVNTTIMPSKTKTRHTKGGMQRGRVRGIKKAIITLGAGEELDFYS